MIEKISVKRICEDHLDTFRVDNGGLDRWELILFFVLPAVVAGIAAWQTCDVPAALLSILITALTILTGLLFNLLLLIYDVTQRSELTGGGVGKPGEEVKRHLLKVTYANISFAILVSIFSIASLCINAVIPVDWPVWIHCVATALIYWFALVLLLDLLMILKRVHSLLRKAFPDGSS